LVGEREKDLTPFPFALGYPQGKTQRLLEFRLASCGTQVEWGTRLVSLSQAQEEVQAYVRRADGEEEVIRAAWLVGTDGAKSVVREQLGISFEGDTYEQVGFLADVGMAAPFETETLHLNLSHGGFVGIAPLGDPQFRLFGAMSAKLAARVGLHEEPDLNLSDLQEWFDQYFFVGHQIKRLHWVAAYRIHRRVVNHYRSGRCFLAGDAAHLHSPAGGQGMNLGIGDAYNLGWKLALVIQQQACPHLLDSYETERRPIALRILKGADRGFALEASKNPLLQQFNLHVLPAIVRVATRLPAVRHLLFEMFSQIWIGYPESPIVADALPNHPGPKAGERAPYGVFDEPAHDLYDLLKDSKHHLFLFEGLQPTLDAQRVEQELMRLVAEYRVALQVHIIKKEERQLHQRFYAEQAILFLIRPDGHIAYRGPADNLKSLSQYLDQRYLKGAAGLQQE